MEASDENISGNGTEVSGPGDIKNLMDDLYDILQKEIDEEVGESEQDTEEEPVDEETEVGEGSQKAIMMKPQRVKMNRYSKEKMYVEEAEIKMKSGDLKGAETYLKKAYTLDPDSYLINFNLGKTLQELGVLNESQLYYDKAITIEDSRYEPWFRMGVISMEKDPPDLNEALVFLKHSRKLSDDPEEIDEHIGICKDLMERNEN